MTEGKELRLERGEQELQNSCTKAMTMGVRCLRRGSPREVPGDP